jgi:tRNA A37 methylthiotransferase MiaB
MFERLYGGSCGEDAKNESVEAILAAARMKKDAADGGKAKKIIVTGCLAQRYSEAGPGQGLTLVHVRAQHEQLQDTCVS